jgi:multidrug efflux pump subunit AcrA (membrane-fusion protein)
MTATITIVGEPGTETKVVSFRVPVSAIFTDPTGAQSVWVVDESTMTVNQRPVQTGKMQADQVEIKEGLKGGERIVTAGTHLLQEGMKVRLYESRTDKNTP